eukprot:Gb_26007 [translate_table: standard]
MTPTVAAIEIFGDDSEVEYERLQFEEAQPEGNSLITRLDVPAPTAKPLSKWYTLLMKDVEGKLSTTEGGKEQKWNVAMDAKIQAVQNNKTWDLVKLFAGKQAIDDPPERWVYKTKYRADGSIDKHKAKFVVKGYKKQKIDYQTTLIPVVKMNIFRIILALVA